MPLQVIEEERPDPKQGEVRVRVLAGGVSLPDLMMREGIHPETMLHRSAEVKSGQRSLIHGAAGGVGTALLQLGHLATLEMYGTCSPRPLGSAAIDTLMWLRRDVSAET